MVDAHLIGKEITTKDITRLIIGGQTGVDGVQFCIANTVNGEDLTDPTLSWFLQFKNKYGLGEPIVLFPVYEDSLIKLPWVPGVTATQVQGRLQIQIYAAKTSGSELVKKWVSAAAVIYVEENLNPGAITPVQPTLLDQYLVQFNSLKADAESAATIAEEQAIIAGQQAGFSSDSASEALLSAQAAGVSAGAALDSEEAAGLSEAAALASEQAAGLSEDNAGLSAAAALASEQAAGASESAANLSAGSASGSALSAGLSEVAAQEAQAIAEEKALLLTDSLAQIAINKAAIEALSYNKDVIGLKYNKVSRVYTRLGAATSWSAGRCAGSYDGNIVSDFDEHPLYGLRKKFKANNDFTEVYFRGTDEYDVFDGDHYVRQPIGWFADYEDADDRIVLLAAMPVPGLVVHPAFLDKNGRPVPFIDYACVEGSVVDGVMYSKPDLQPKNRFNISEFSSAARAKSATEKFTCEPWIASDFEVLMMAVEFGTFDVQSAIGEGISTMLISDNYKTTFASTASNTFITTNAIAAQFIVGDFVDLGTSYSNGSLVMGRKILAVEEYDSANKILTFDGASVMVPIDTVITWGSGAVSSDMIDIMQGKSGYILERGSQSKSHVCWRDVWDKWGNDWEIKDGAIKFDNRMYVGTDPDTYHLYYNNPSVAGSTYKDTGFTTGQTDGYVGSMKRVGAAGSKFTIPVVDALGGVSVGGYGAYHYDNNGAGASRLVLVGGSRAGGRNCSPVSVYLNYSVSSAPFDIASRLFHKAQA